MKIRLRPIFHVYKKFVILALILVTIWYLFIHNKGAYYEQSKSALKSYSMASSCEKKDWHDWKFIEYEKNRKGPGEQGKPFKLTDPEDIELNNQLFEVEGLYVIVSDKISVNRSVPDTRLPQ